MEPPILYLKDMELGFGGSPLLLGASLTVGRQDRICLVGRNGTGKSTLMKLAAGLLEADKGERFIQPGITTRYLPQEPDLSNYDTVFQYVADGLAPGDDPHRAKYLLEELEMGGDEKTAFLSGGEMRRAALARTLAPQPDILFLDEPTNHLDLPAIEWLESELRNSRSALVLISHDRRFLENLSNTTVWMDRGKSRILNRGFSDFEDWRDKILEEEELEAHKLDRKIVREEHWIVHGVSGRRKRNMRRVRELAALKQKRAGQSGPATGATLATTAAEKSGKLVAKLENVSKKYDNRFIIKDFSANIMRGDRIGIVGPNGAGKTTLVNLITGKAKPDSGDIRLGIGLDILTIDQKREMLKPHWSLKDALTDGAGDMVAIGGQNRHVLSYMKDFLFLPEQAGTPVNVLSGGERAKLMLARGLRQSSNFLVLDEPTNDLDLETLDLLQEFIGDYSGTVLLVSHDRDFIDRTCTSVIASDGDGTWHVYAGGYTDMVSQKGSGVEKRKSRDKTENVPKTTTPKTSPMPRSSKARLSFKHKHALETLPGEISKLETEIAKLKTALAAPDLYANEPEKFEKFANALSERETLLAQKEEEWLEIEMLREEAEG